jgi:hypothetical protein
MAMPVWAKDSNSAKRFVPHAFVPHERIRRQEVMKKCGIPAKTLPPCDLEWGHDGDVHFNAGDGFYAREHLEEHRRRRHERREQEARAKKETA